MNLLRFHTTQQSADDTNTDANETSVHDAAVNSGQTPQFSTIGASGEPKASTMTACEFGTQVQWKRKRLAILRLRFNVQQAKFAI